MAKVLQNPVFALPVNGSVRTPFGVILWGWLILLFLGGFVGFQEAHRLTTDACLSTTLSATNHFERPLVSQSSSHCGVPSKQIGEPPKSCLRLPALPPDHSEAFETHSAEQSHLETQQHGRLSGHPRVGAAKTVLLVNRAFALCQRALTRTAKIATTLLTIKTRALLLKPRENDENDENGGCHSKGMLYQKHGFWFPDHMEWHQTLTAAHNDRLPLQPRMTRVSFQKGTFNLESLDPISLFSLENDEYIFLENGPLHFLSTSLSFNRTSGITKNGPLWHAPT